MLTNRFIGPAALTAGDREIISQGLTALLRERSIAYEIAVQIAISRGLDRPTCAISACPTSSVLVGRFNKTIVERVC